MDSFKKQIRTATGLMRRNAGDFIPRRRFLWKAGIFAAGAATLKAVNLATDEIIVRGVEPIAELPYYGRWCGQRFRTASLTQQRVGPRYQRCQSVVYTDNRTRQRALYDVLLLPYPNGDVVSITKRIELQTVS